jgi:Cu(I)/Ag(I) efflux system periplasmic protein CusF
VCHIIRHERSGIGCEVDLMSRRSAVAKAMIALAAMLAAADAAAQTHHGTGTVRAVLPRVHRLVVDAGDIPGYMPAMEMSYPVEPAGLLDGLKRGDRIEFDIDAKNATITHIRVIGGGSR